MNHADSSIGLSVSKLKLCPRQRMLFAGNLLKHPCFDEMRKSGKGYRIAGSLENTDRIMRDTFWIGVYPGLSEAMLDYAAGQIESFFGVNF